MIDITGYKVLEDGTIIGKRGKPMLGNVNKYGYIYMTINGKKVTHHRIVAQELVPNPHNKPCVNHIDGDKQNNHPSNLEWATHSENSKHSYDFGLQSQLGDKNNGRKLSEVDVHEIRWLWEIGVSQKDIAEAFGVERSNIAHIVHRRSWKHI